MKSLLTKKTYKTTVIRLAVYILLALILLFPFFVMFSKSLMTIDEVVDIPVKYFPAVPQFGNYIDAIKGDFFRPLMNTLIVVVVQSVTVPLASYIVAYGFTKIKPIGSSVLYVIGMSTLILPGIVTTIPLYVLYIKLHWINTLTPLIVPPMLGGGMMNIFLMQQFLMGIPNSFRGAAKVDGANELRICFFVIAPMAYPIITYVAVTTFMGAWNNFTGPLVYIDDPNFFTLPVALYKRFYGKTALRDLQYNVQCAMCVIMMIPSLLLFAKFQKTLIGGISLGGLKG